MIIVQYKVFHSKETEEKKIYSKTFINLKKAYNYALKTQGVISEIRLYPAGLITLRNRNLAETAREIAIKEDQKKKNRKIKGQTELGSMIDDFNKTCDNCIYCGETIYYQSTTRYCDYYKDYCHERRKYGLCEKYFPLSIDKN